MPSIAIALTIVLQLGCASLPPAPLGPVHPLPLGINSGYHGFSPETFQFCPHLIRTPQTSSEALAAFLAATPPGCEVLALIEAPDLALVDAFANQRPAAIELGNELELRPSELTPSQYVDWIDHALARLVAAPYFGSIVLGGVYAITPDTKTAIIKALAICGRYQIDCIVGVHLYDASDQDLQWLRDLHRRIWVTEIGFPTRCDPARLELQRSYIVAQLARLSTVPLIERVFVYQRVSGPSCSDFDTFGIEGKPSAELLQ